MKKLLFILLAAMQFIAHGQQLPGNKERVRDWYEAFDKHDPALIDTILSRDWTDIPAMPNQAVGPVGAKQVLGMIEQTFPDFRIAVKDVLQDGNKVVVRSEIKSTQHGRFAGREGTGRTLTIMAIDIHEFDAGKIVRTWHVEDWMSGLRQLGFVEEH
jgi:steroid delta-isomerase-like uncharacterized protein